MRTSLKNNTFPLHMRFFLCQYWSNGYFPCMTWQIFRTHVYAWEILNTRGLYLCIGDPTPSNDFLLRGSTTKIIYSSYDQLPKSIFRRQHGKKSSSFLNLTHRRPFIQSATESDEISYCCYSLMFFYHSAATPSAGVFSGQIGQAIFAGENQHREQKQMLPAYDSQA